MKRRKGDIAEILIKFEKSDDPALIFSHEYHDHHQRLNDEIFSKEWSAEERFVIQSMVEIGLLRIENISGKPWQDGGEAVSYLHVTPVGHDFLAEWRRNRWWWRLWRGSCSFMEGVFQSIVTPVVVAWATVLVLRYFGLGND